KPLLITTSSVHHPPMQLCSFGLDAFLRKGRFYATSTLLPINSKITSGCDNEEHPSWKLSVLENKHHYCHCTTCTASMHRPPSFTFSNLFITVTASKSLRSMTPSK
ncbi:hypothetical protein GW17_00061230, partial [Ensete ventricosum]